MNSDNNVSCQQSTANKRQRHGHHMARTRAQRRRTKDIGRANGRKRAPATLKNIHVA